MSALTAEELYNQAIFAALHSSPRTITWYCALGLGFEGLVIGAILTQVYRYYEHFHLQDARVTLFLVGVGTIGCLGQFAVNLWQTYMFIDKAATAINSIIIKDVYADMVILIFVGLYNLGAVAYFSKRAIKLVGKARLFAPLLGFMGIASFAMCIACVCSGFNLPHNPAELETWIARVNRYVIAWTAVALVTDVSVCIAMTYALLKCRDELKAAATSLLRKLLMMTFETMVPPALVVLLLLVFGGITTATMGNFSRVLVWCTGPLYFHAILHSLVGRQDVQFILQRGAGQSTHSGGQNAANNRGGGYADDSLGTNAGMRAELGIGMQMVPVSEREFGGRTKKELGLEDEYEYRVNLS
ncbi:hypothetical protein IAT40_004366 [Kwoniella sp. CBS 6097]